MTMERLFDLVVACVCCAISFPVIGLKPKRKEMGLGWIPIPPDQAELDMEAANPKNSWFHLKKDLFVNSVRADSEWWGKFLSFCIVSLSLVAVSLVVRLVIAVFAFISTK